MFIFDVRGHTAVKNVLESSGHEVLPGMMDCGDCLFQTHDAKTVGFEIKEANDLLSSLRSGRLFEQTSTMLNSYDISFLLIYGFLGWDIKGVLRTNGGFKESPPWPNLKSLSGALLSIQYNGVIVPPVMQTDTNAGEYIVQAYRWFQKTHHNSMYNRQKNFNLGGAEQLYAMHIVTGIPKVSAVLGERLLEKFKTPQGVMNATLEELTEVHGIGKRMAKIIYDSARTEWLT